MHVTHLSTPKLLVLVVAASALLALTPALVVQAVFGTTTTIVVAPNPAVYGRTVVITVTVRSNDRLSTCDVPSGAVVLRNGDTPIVTQTLDINGVTVFMLAGLAPGPYGLSARYLGSRICPASTSSVQNLSVKEATNTSLVAGPNPSVTGQWVTLTAHVVWNGPDTIGGMLDFFDNGTYRGNAYVDQTQSYAKTVIGFVAGIHVLTATVAEALYQFSSTSIPITQVVNPAGTTLALTSAPNPSFFSNTVAITATATITPPGGGTLDGCVNWYDNGVPLGSCVVFDANNRAVLNWSNLALGAHSITAQYGGTSNYVGSTAGVWLQVVNPDTTATLVTWPNPSSPGQWAYFVVNVAGITGTKCANATGTVDLKDNGTTIGTVFYGGQTIFAISSLTVGSHPMSAVYLGDGGNCSASVSATQLQIVSWRLFLPLIMR